MINGKCLVCQENGVYTAVPLSHDIDAPGILEDRNGFRILLGLKKICRDFFARLQHSNDLIDPAAYKYIFHNNTS